VRKPEGKRPLGRHKHIWENNNKTDLKEIMLSAADWIYLAQDRDQKRVFVITVTNTLVP
jgi:hypothetical protein